VYVYKKCKVRNIKVGGDRQEGSVYPKIAEGSMQARCKGERTASDVGDAIEIQQRQCSPITTCE
jgi:pyridoxal biosynthesis lyase PdxS